MHRTSRNSVLRRGARLMSDRKLGSTVQIKRNVVGTGLAPAFGPEPGTLYGVGVGPGAPDLLTLRAQQILRTSPVICLPASAHGQSYAGSIIEHLLDHERQEVLLVSFPMVRDPQLALPAREQAVTLVLERLQAGLSVAFATEGDPLLYSTFGYLLE